MGQEVGGAGWPGIDVDANGSPVDVTMRPGKVCSVCTVVEVGYSSSVTP